MQVATLLVLPTCVVVAVCTVLQAGCGFYTSKKDPGATREHSPREQCPRISKLVVELRPSIPEDSHVARAFLALRTLTVDIDAQTVASAPNFEAVPCTDAVCVWRHFKTVGPGAEDGQVPFRRIGMAVMNTTQLTILQRQFLFQVRESEQRDAGSSCSMKRLNLPYRPPRLPGDSLHSLHVWVDSFPGPPNVVTQRCCQLPVRRQNWVHDRGPACSALAVLDC